ncbi:MAG: dTDP-4-dehydrorhamnose reductase, partial [Janthinobacterium lividum]
TEAHLGCSDPREQVLWLMEAWRAALTLRAEKADIRAVTAWALLGLVDWDTMLCQQNHRFEPGALTTRDHAWRSTLLADAIASLAHGNQFTHPALLSLGWWQRDDRTYAKRA